MKELAKKIYYSETVMRIRLGITPIATERDRALYNEAQKLDEVHGITAIYLHEASQFLGLPEKEIRHKCLQSGSVKEEWFIKGRKTKEDIEDFYEGDSFFYSDILASKIDKKGMGYIGLRKTVGSLQASLTLRNSLGNEYLDYGCGMGSCAILFGKHNFQVSIADISNKMLSFSKFRLTNRKIPCQLYNLRRDTLPSNRFAFITCFDVLEHVSNPIEVMTIIRNTLKPGGIVFLYFAYGYSRDNPTHIVNDGTCIKEFNKLGFQEDIGLRDIIMKDRINFFVFKKR